MRGVTSVLKTASRLPASLLKAHEQHVWSVFVSPELTRAGQWSSVPTTRSYACASAGMRTFASAPTFLQREYSKGITPPLSGYNAVGRPRKWVGLQVKLRDLTAGSTLLSV